MKDIMIIIFCILIGAIVSVILHISAKYFIYPEPNPIIHRLINFSTAVFVFLLAKNNFKELYKKISSR